MGKIKIGSASYSFEEIRMGSFTGHNAYLEKTLTFCRDWLLGKTSFELQTSGSTGKPKTIIVLRRQMECSAKATRSYFGIQSGAKLLCCLNTSMVAGKMMLVRALEWDAELTIVEPISDPFVELPPDDFFDFVAMVPMQVAATLANISNPLQRIGILIVGGAPSTPELILKLASENLNAFQTYGMTETVSHVALSKITGGEPIYEALPGVKIGTDVEGRLVLEAEMALEGRVQTNDLVELMGENSFKWIGRADFTVNSGGVKLQPEQIEKTLEAFLSKTIGKRAFFLGGKPDPLFGEALILLVEGSALPNDQKLIEDMKAFLPQFQAPKAIHFIPEFVRTPSGKINRIQTLSLLP